MKTARTFLNMWIMRLLITVPPVLLCITALSAPATAGIKIIYTIENPGHFQSILGNKFLTFKTNLDVARDHLSDALGGKGAIDVLIKIDETYQTASSEIEHWSNSALAYGVLEPGTVFEARTGTDPNANNPDITVKFPKAFLTDTVWFDPSGMKRNANVPPDKLDFITVILHETVHGMGISGFRRDTSTMKGAFLEGKRSTFDFFTDWGKPGSSGIKEDSVAYHGPYGAKEHGGLIELTSNDGGYYHLGNPKGTDTLADDLMAGATFTGIGYRNFVSILDRAILRDLGWQPLYRAAELDKMLDFRGLRKVQPKMDDLPKVDPSKLKKKSDESGGN